MTILLFGEIYSENLGDGVIAETLAFLIGKHHPLRKIRFMDMSGRSGYTGTVGMAESYGTRVAAGLFRLCGAPSVRRALRAINWHVRNRKRFLRSYDEALRDVSCVIIGGGQLLMDNNLSFPLKIAQMIECATARGVPVKVASVGVGGEWSSYASRLLVPALRRVGSISVRDQKSAERLAARGIPGVRLTADPALFASNCYGPPPLTAVRERRLGLGVMAPDSYNRYSKGQAAWKERELTAFWTELCRTLAARRIPFALFTNGSREDDAFARGLGERLPDIFRHGAGMVTPRPTRPAQLAATIAGFGCTISFRLHASIIATSYGIPALGLSWDEKVECFFKGIGMPERCMSLDRNSAAEIARHGETLLRDPAVSEKLPEVKAQLEQEVTLMLDDLAP